MSFLCTAKCVFWFFCVCLFVLVFFSIVETWSPVAQDTLRLVRLLESEQALYQLGSIPSFCLFNYLKIFSLFL